MNEEDLHRAVLDACVLYPPGLRNLFMWLALESVFVPKWTAQIHEEWISNALEGDAKRNDPPQLTRGKLERARSLMDHHSVGSNVTGYERHIASLSLPDPDDRHVLAAAIESDTDTIVTFNVRDFPKSALAHHGVEAIKPDDFLCELYDGEPALFWGAVERLRASLKKPPMSIEELCQRYQKLGLNRLVQRLQGG